MDFSPKLDVNQKALAINLDTDIYGSFAEIGAGQEVVRHFFRAGGAAGTIAKSICAYDMKVSDEIYGREASGRYVCEERLQKMLKREYDLLVERLEHVRPHTTKFFAFSNTVAAKSYRGNNDSHGWLGVRFQNTPKGEPCEIVIHVKMLDKENLQQQEALGIIGVNLIYASFNWAHDRSQFVLSLLDGLSLDRIEIDMIRVHGEAFLGVDSRLWTLELVRRRYCNAVLFDATGRVVQVSDQLYKKNLVILRGSFRPPTLRNFDMLERSYLKLKEMLSPEDQENLMALPEMSMGKIMEVGEFNSEDFLSRVNLLTEIKRPVLISNLESFHSLNNYLSKLTKFRQIGFAIGVYNLEHMLSPEKYKGEEKGLLGGIGELLGNNTKLFVYPACFEDDLKKLKHFDDLQIGKDQKHLLDYLLSQGLVIPMEDFDESLAKIWTKEVLKNIQSGNDGWEKFVPTEISNAIKKKNLFGYKKT